MANRNQNQASKTNAQEVRQQNASSQGQGSFGTEFASETNAQEVRQQNSQSQANKGQGNQ
ncbi:gamma-type small acid-soluble spore protein [Bacillus suaedaesalsae]|uniref:Small, acid-soluble spore protein gamma-type n=1 Tax=Bacillus suaedaesalsae TaxID=2810349 RepID=A0ABS2DDE8_9BACI|nr:gamma-type small acid-soluble spore protein [Bacillus suaedaesalsae]MBM6616456.1 gamma-type small acid-soluble spore protein [Bacillus suaedaesalsae]